MLLLRILFLSPFILGAILSLPAGGQRPHRHSLESRSLNNSSSRGSSVDKLRLLNGSSVDKGRHITVLSARAIDTALGPRCGPGMGNCEEALCCSPAGYCGFTRDHCRSPDCQLDYGSCDASRTPQGLWTIDIPRPRLGAVPYGQKVFACTVPRTVALTFDDGPNIYTSDVLDLLDSFNAKATFFISGVNSGKGQIDDFTLPWGQLIQRMHYSGHQIASHSWSHQDLSRISSSQRRDQILKNEAAIRNIIGGIPTYMRPPYSSCTVESGCMDDMDQLGLHVTYFNLDTDDYNNDHPAYIQRSKDIFDRAMAMQDPPGRPFLVIAHDVHEQTVHNLTAHILHAIYDAGYRPVTVGECLDDPRDFWYRWDNRAQNVDQGH